MCHLPWRSLAGGDPATGDKWRPAHSCFSDSANESGSVPAANLATRQPARLMRVCFDMKKEEVALVQQPCAKPIILDCEVIEGKDS